MKITKIARLLITASFLLIVLCSCTAVDTVKGWFSNEEAEFNLPIEEQSDPKRAASILTKVAENMEALDSYTLNATMNLEMQVYGIDVVGEYSLYTEEQYRNTDNLIVYNDTTGVVTMGKDKTTTDKCDGFIGGNYYRTYKDSKSDYDMRSKMTAAEYKEFVKEGSDGLDLDYSMSDFSSLTSEKTDEGWKITLAGVKEDSELFTLFSDLLGEDIPLALGAAFSDIVMVVYTTPDYYCVKETMEFVYTPKEGASEKSVPKIYAECVYENLNSTEATRITVGHFKQVYNISLVNKAKRALEEFYESKNGSYNLDLRRPGSTVAEATYTVNYSTPGGRFAYDMTAEIGGETTFISYSNGKLIYGVEGSGWDVENSDDETERESIFSAAFPAELAADNVYSVKKGPTDDSFVLDMNADGYNVSYTFYFSADKIVGCNALINYRGDTLSYTVTDLVYD